MALLNVFYDTATQRLKAGATGGATLFVDEDFTLGAPATFVQLVNTITATQRLDVYINGQLVQESQSWTRDFSTAKVNFTFTVPTDAWIRVREWNF